MMTELLKDNLLETQKDMTRLFNQTYNFDDRQEQTPQWLIDRNQEEAQKKMSKEQSKEEKKKELQAFKARV